MRIVRINKKHLIILGSVLAIFVAILLLVLVGKFFVFAENSGNPTASSSSEIQSISDYDISEFFYFKQEGKASWYGKRFHKRGTASGEKFDMYRFTAAHRYLPFGTIVRIRNTQNDSVLLVRINDRGPFVYSKIIDLSYNSAKYLDAFGNPYVEIEALVPKSDTELEISEKYYFGYSFEYPLVCLPENKIVFLKEFDVFEDALDFYKTAQSEFPDQFLYLFVPFDQGYKNIKYLEEQKFYVGYYASPNKEKQNKYVQINSE